MRRTAGVSLAVLVALAFACGDDDSAPTNGANGTSGGPNGTSSGANGTSGGPTDPGTPTGDAGPSLPPAVACANAGGSATVAAPTLLRTLVDPKGVESWLASPAIADLDGDGKVETIVVRESRVVVWGADGKFKWEFATGKDRVWASPIVGNFTGDDKLEIAVAARDSAWLLDASGKVLPGWPQKFGTAETRSIAAGDLDGDGFLDVAVAVRNKPDVPGAADDIVKAYHGSGAAVAGFPPTASGVSGCSKTTPCEIAGLYDQNIAIGLLGPADGPDGAKQGIVIPHDDAYASFFHGTGVVFDANPMFKKSKKTSAVRYFHDLPLAIQGYADDEQTANQAHFTNTPPAIADIDKDGTPEIVMVGSVQNAAQSDRLRGVALWVMQNDASRHKGWEAPFHVPKYVMGLNDGFSPKLDEDPVAGADNLVGLTNQVTVADIDPKPGLEMIFAGYDGKIHAVAADKTELWSTDYATNGRALTPGILAADLSADGVPEIVFATFTPDKGTGALYIFSAAGQQLQKIALPGRGAMAVPTIGDVDGDGTLDIVVSLKDEGKDSTLVYKVPGAKPNCLLWPTGRANYLRNGWVR